MTDSGARAPFGQRQYHPIYEACERRGLRFAIHPGTDGMGVNVQPSPGYPTRYIEWHTCLSQRAQAHLVSLVCQGVFVRFPRLKFVFVECGIGWLPHVMWRLDKNYKALRNEVTWLTSLPSDYIKEHVRVTSQPVEEPPNDEQFLWLLEQMDAKRTLMLSTDYPHWDFDDPIAAFARVPDDYKHRIFHDTAAELYGL